MHKWLKSRDWGLFSFFLSSFFTFLHYFRCIYCVVCISRSELVSIALRSPQDALTIASTIMMYRLCVTRKVAWNRIVGLRKKGKSTHVVQRTSIIKRLLFYVMGNGLFRKLPCQLAAFFFSGCTSLLRTMVSTFYANWVHLHYNYIRTLWSNGFSFVSKVS